MQIKTFEAVDMKQALALVKKELGASAVILSSRQVRKDGGLFGAFGRRVLEVTAASQDAPEPAAEPDSVSLPQPGKVRARPPRPAQVYNELRAVKQAMDPVLDEVRAIREQMSEISPRDPRTDDLQADVAQIRTLLSTLVSTGTVAPDEQGAAAQRLAYFLLARGIDEPLARSLVQRVVAKVETGGLADLERLKLNLAAEMRSDLGRAERGGPPSRIQLFVGPTGVGKTTTIAKLAARAAQDTGERVNIITTDVHRVAAVEQMTRFGQILDIPVEVALGPDDLRRALEHMDGRVFIDTTGRNHRDPTTLRELQRLLAAAGSDAEVMLVISATTRAQDSREILDMYMKMAVSRLILTKLDETRVYGELYNCIVRSGRPIACVTTGQAVPEHLESLDVPGILRKVLHG